MGKCYVSAQSTASHSGHHFFGQLDVPKYTATGVEIRRDIQIHSLSFALYHIPLSLSTYRKQKIIEYSINEIEW